MQTSRLAGHDALITRCTHTMAWKHDRVAKVAATAVAAEDGGCVVW